MILNRLHESMLTFNTSKVLKQNHVIFPGPSFLSLAGIYW